MFWDIFFKKSSDKDDEQKEYIDIIDDKGKKVSVDTVSYTHLRAHET